MAQAKPKKKSWWSRFVSKFTIGAKSPRPSHEQTGEYAQEGSYAGTQGRLFKGTNLDITIGRIRQRNADMAKEAGLGK
jgi:hypothetical protein